MHAMVCLHRGPLCVRTVCHSVCATCTHKRTVDASHGAARDLAGRATNRTDDNEMKGLCHDPPHYHSLCALPRGLPAPQSELRPRTRDLTAMPVNVPQNRLRGAGVVACALGSPARSAAWAQGSRGSARAGGSTLPSFLLLHSARSNQQLARIRLAAAAVPPASQQQARLSGSASKSPRTHPLGSSSSPREAAGRRVYPLSLRLPHACAWVGGAAPAGRWRPIRAPARRPCRLRSSPAPRPRCTRRAPRARQWQPLDVHDRPQQPQSRSCARTALLARSSSSSGSGYGARAQEGPERPPRRPSVAVPLAAAPCAPRGLCTSLFRAASRRAWRGSAAWRG